MDPMTEKLCTKCRVTKDKEEFYSWQDKKSGATKHPAWCKECMKEHSAKNSQERAFASRAGVIPSKKMRTPLLVREHRAITTHYQSQPRHGGICLECNQERQLLDDSYSWCEICYQRMTSNRHAKLGG